jgi:AcrR family transcriptional regulator
MTGTPNKRARSGTSPSTLYGKTASEGDAREKILRTAYDLFAVHGINQVGIDLITGEAGVAKMSLYRHFGSKEDLVLAVLERREERWTREWLIDEVTIRAETAAERLLAFFDVFDEWCPHPDYECCVFTNALLESWDWRSRIGTASLAKLMNVRAILRGLAEEAGVRDPDEFAAEWQTLLWGSIVGASGGEADAAKRARKVAELLLESETSS